MASLWLVVEKISVLLACCCCVKNSDQKQQGRKGVYLACKSQSVIKGGQGRNPGSNLEAGTDRGGCCVLAYFPWLTQPVSLYIPGPPAQDWYCGQWAGSSSVRQHQANAPQKCPQANMMEVISQLRFPLPGIFQVDNYDQLVPQSAPSALFVLMEEWAQACLHLCGSGSREP